VRKKQPPPNDILGGKKKKPGLMLETLAKGIFLLKQEKFFLWNFWCPVHFFISVIGAFFWEAPL